MIAGDRDYFVCDMICDVAIKVYMKGKPYKALLTQDKVDAALKSNKMKALREYYNRPSRDGGVNQIIKWGTVRRNERKYIHSFIGIGTISIFLRLILPAQWITLLLALCVFITIQKTACVATL